MTKADGIEPSTSGCLAGAQPDEPLPRPPIISNYTISAFVKTSSTSYDITGGVSIELSAE